MGRPFGSIELTEATLTNIVGGHAEMDFQEALQRAMGFFECPEDWQQTKTGDISAKVVIEIDVDYNVRSGGIMLSSMVNLKPPKRMIQSRPLHYRGGKFTVYDEGTQLNLLETTAHKVGDPVDDGGEGKGGV